MLYGIIHNKSLSNYYLALFTLERSAIANYRTSLGRMTAYLFDKAESASLISFIYIGMIFGGPVLTF
ncbi:hypothetical protein [Legionella moravica]|uniref:hypothetical protein n=1 Tax=Legionella moravica TaxID=39962 RepID=UPI0012DF48DF|nr:hypothetical protein [Legionella moravica]